MSVRRPPVFVECPRCASANATLTQEGISADTFFCPQCQHLWNMAPRERMVVDVVVRFE
jgi:transposase-like protein